MDTFSANQGGKVPNIPDEMVATVLPPWNSKLIHKTASGQMIPMDMS